MRPPLTLKVGEVYRGTFGFSVCWLRITGIVVRPGSTRIYYRASDWKWPRLLSFFGCPSSDSLKWFLEDLYEAASQKNISEVEVRYK